MRGFIGYIPLSGKNHTDGVLNDLFDAISTARAYDKTPVLAMRKSKATFYSVHEGLDAIKGAMHGDSVEYVVACGADPQDKPLHVPSQNKVMFQYFSELGLENNQLCKYVEKMSSSSDSFGAQLAKEVYGTLHKHESSLLGVLSERASFVLSSNKSAMHLGGNAPIVSLAVSRHCSMLVFGEGTPRSNFCYNLEARGYDTFPMFTLDRALLVINPTFVSSKWFRIVQANLQHNKNNPVHVYQAFRRNLMARVVNIPKGQ